MPLTPNNREESWLKGMVDGSTTLTQTKRREYWYQEIINAQGGGGGGSSVLVVNSVEYGDDFRLSETWQTIYDAMAENKIVIISYIDTTEAYMSIVTAVAPYDDNYGVWADFASGAGEPTYLADTVNDYPVSL